MKASTRADMLMVWDSLVIGTLIMWLIGVWLVACFASVVGWRRLEHWCAVQLGDAP